MEKIKAKTYSAYVTTDTYRHGASVLLLRSFEGTYQILLLRKPRKNDSWQLPQGGIEEGETMEQAALRELHEEAGVKDCDVLGASAQEYCYTFPPSYRRFRPDHVCGQKIGFILALSPADVGVRVDGKEIDAHVWVIEKDVAEFVNRKEYLELVQALYKEALAILEARNA